MIELTAVAALEAMLSHGSGLFDGQEFTVGLLATDGTIKLGLYQGKSVDLLRL